MESGSFSKLASKSRLSYISAFVVTTFPPFSRVALRFYELKNIERALWITEGRCGHRKAHSTTLTMKSGPTTRTRSLSREISYGYMLASAIFDRIPSNGLLIFSLTFHQATLLLFSCERKLQESTNIFITWIIYFFFFLSSKFLFYLVRREVVIWLAVSRKDPLAPTEPDLNLSIAHVAKNPRGPKGLMTRATIGFLRSVSNARP